MRFPLPPGGLAGSPHEEVEREAEVCRIVLPFLGMADLQADDEVRTQDRDEMNIEDAYNRYFPTSSTRRWHWLTSDVDVVRRSDLEEMGRLMFKREFPLCHLTETSGN